MSIGAEKIAVVGFFSEKFDEEKTFLNKHEK